LAAVSYRSALSQEQAQVLAKIQLTEKVKEEALAHAKRCDPEESCGLAVVSKRKMRYVPAANIAANPTEDFILDPAAVREAELTGDIVAVIHSHVAGPAEPSPADRASCDAHGIPWCIVQARQGTWARLDPSSEPAPLAGLPWVWGAADCWTLVRNWYGQQGIELPEFERPATPEEFEASPFFDSSWEKAGFVEVSRSEARFGDAVLMNLRGKGLNHVGVIVEDGLILHHVRGCLSGREPLNEWLSKSIGRVLRHPQISA